MRPADVVDWVIFLGYLAVILSIGIYFTRRQNSQEEYFVGGRSMNWIAVGISLFATSFSSISFLAYPREGAYEDYHLLLTLLCIPLLIVPILWFVFVPLFHRLKVTSIYEYLGQRFDNRVRRFGSILFFGYAVGWMGSMLYGMGLILQAVLGVGPTETTLLIIGIGTFAVIYTSLGGVQAVIWNDVLQTVVLGGGMCIVFFIALGRIDGGVSEIISTGVAANKFDMFNMTLDITERRSFWTAIAFALFMYLPGYTVSQTTAQRYVCIDSLKKARHSLLVSSIVSTSICFLFFFVGTTLYVYYNRVGAGGFPELARQDQLLPWFVANEANVTGLVGLIVAGLFAAALSTIDSGINSMTAVIVYDWLDGEHVSIKTSRLFSVLFGVLIVGAALISPYVGQYLIEIIAKVVGVFLGLLLGIFLVGMYVPKADSRDVIIGTAVGSVLLILVWTTTGLPHWWYGAVSIGGTFIAGWLMSMTHKVPGDA